MPKRIPATKKAQRTTIAKRIVEQKPVTAIAAELGISRVSVYNELQQPETQALIQSWMQPHHKRLQAVIDRSISQVERALTMDEASRLNRIEALTDRIGRLRTVIQDRAEECETNPELAAVPGMSTGTMVYRQRALGSFGITTEYEVDAGLLKELREHERQLRDELNDFGPNLKAVERARDLLEMAEGTKQDGSDGKPKRFEGELVELLALYARIQKSQ